MLLNVILRVLGCFVWLTSSSLFLPIVSLTLCFCLTWPRILISISVSAPWTHKIVTLEQSTAVCSTILLLFNVSLLTSSFIYCSEEAQFPSAEETRTGCTCTVYNPSRFLFCRHYFIYICLKEKNFSKATGMLLIVADALFFF